jgi:Fe-S cluster assembly scaffold protein SufB
MREFRLRSYDKFMTKPTPKWGCDLSKINFHNIYLHATTSEKIVDMSDTFGIPKAKGVVEKEYEEAYRKQRENVAKEVLILRLQSKNILSLLKNISER